MKVYTYVVYNPEKVLSTGVVVADNKDHALIQIGNITDGELDRCYIKVKIREF